jgi:hypothetical protein
MRQIGMRQEAGRLGGIGSCGRELCCSTWLTNFKTVSTAAARYQNLSLNTLKLAGQCGKLKCCLNYELDTYLDALKDIPDRIENLQTEVGVARHQKTDIFKKLMWFAYPNAEDWIPLKVDRVKEIMAMNKKGLKPNNLKEEAFELASSKPVEKVLDYENVVGQDSLTRLDDKSKSKSARNNNNNNNRKQERPPRAVQQRHSNDGTLKAAEEARPEGSRPEVKRPDGRRQEVKRPEGKRPEQRRPEVRKVSTDLPLGEAGAVLSPDVPVDGQAIVKPAGNRNNRNRNNRRKKPAQDKPKDE